MNNLLHFAKILGLCGAAAMVVYIAVIYRWGFAVGVRLHSGSSRPPMWVVQTLFWLWPLVLVFFGAIVWELIRVAVLRKA